MQDSCFSLIKNLVFLVYKFPVFLFKMIFFFVYDKNGKSRFMIFNPRFWDEKIRKSTGNLVCLLSFVITATIIFSFFSGSFAAAFGQKSNSISWNKTLESLLFFAEFVCMFFCCSRLTFSTRRITAEQNWKQSKVEAKAKKKQAKNKKEILLFVFQKVVWRVTKRSCSKRNDEDEELSKK